MPESGGDAYRPEGQALLGGLRLRSPAGLTRFGTKIDTAFASMTHSPYFYAHTHSLLYSFSQVDESQKCFVLDIEKPHVMWYPAIHWS